MCNLYRVRASRDEVAQTFRADSSRFEGQEPEKDYTSPGRDGWVIRESEGQRIIDLQKWGWPNPRGGQPVVNVRNYTSPFWRSALTTPERRCLVPFTQFQEWSVEPDPSTGKKRAYWFSLPSGPIGAFAGIWRPSEAGPIYSFLTCGYGDHEGAASNHIVGAIHPKAIPVILHDEDIDTWLHSPVDDALGLACAFPSQLMAVEG